ncbi:MAG: hypothetical protein VYE22_28175 [Myxococcota bacterium]|nr:hypothetical protein [Myxococcota bacterium]
MIVELIVGAGLVMAGAAAARMLMRRGELDAEEGQPDAEPEADDAPPKRRRAPLREGPRGLRVGDVLLHGAGELWLAGAIELDEEGFVARLFPTPGGTSAGWVAQLDDEASDLATLEETDEVPDGAVPEALPIAGRRVRLERRGHATVTRSGEHLPRTEASCRYTILSDAGGKVLVVVDFDTAPRIALVGDRVARHMIDLLPGGDLED